MTRKLLIVIFCILTVQNEIFAFVACSHRARHGICAFMQWFSDCNYMNTSVDRDMIYGRVRIVSRDIQ